MLFIEFHQKINYLTTPTMVFSLNQYCDEFELFVTA